jgi:DNA-directed RNA polymerase specialized sigma24 family protein
MADEDLTYLEKLARATVMLMIERRGTEHEESLRSELLLARAGFGAAEIADLLGKQTGAVRMAIKRARTG